MTKKNMDLPNASGTNKLYQHKGLPYSYSEMEDRESRNPSIIDFLLGIILVCGAIYAFFILIMRQERKNIREMERQRLMRLEEGREDVEKWARMYKDVPNEHEYI